MIRINVSFSKKLPGSAEYSSDGFHCLLEMEASDSVLQDPSELRQKMAWLWGEAKRSVEDQIHQNGNGNHPPPHKVPAPPAASPTTGPKNGDQPASPKQIKYILNLGQRQNGLTLAALKTFLEGEVGEGEVHKLTKQQASRAIEVLMSKEDK